MMSTEGPTFSFGFFFSIENTMHHSIFTYGQLQLHCFHYNGVSCFSFFGLFPNIGSVIEMAK